MGDDKQRHLLDWDMSFIDTLSIHIKYIQLFLKSHFSRLIVQTLYNDEYNKCLLNYIFEIDL